MYILSKKSFSFFLSLLFPGTKNKSYLLCTAKDEYSSFKIWVKVKHNCKLFITRSKVCCQHMAGYEKSEGKKIANLKLPIMVVK